MNLTQGTVEHRHILWLRRRNLRPTTIYQRERAILRLMRRLQAPSILWATTLALEEHLDHIADAGSRRTEMCHLRGFFRWAHEEGLISADPTARLARIRPRKYLPRPIPHDDLRRALADAPERVKPWLYLAAYAGLRACEIATLRVEHLHWDEGMIFVAQTKGGGMSAVPLHPTLAAVLRDRLPAQGWAFTKDDGQPLNPWNVSHGVNRYLHGLGITHTLHTLRHWFGTEVHRLSGGDLRRTQELMRHDSPVSTAGYTWMDPGDGARVVAGLRA